MESKWVPVEERNGQMENAISVLAMLSSALGIRHTSEVVAMGIGAFIHNMFAGGTAVDGALSIISGVLTAKGRIQYAVIPTTFEVVQGARDMKQGKLLEKNGSTENLSRAGLFALGLFAAGSKQV